MVRRLSSKPRRGGYHTSPKPSNSNKEPKIEEFDRTLFSPNPRQQEEESEFEIRNYLRDHFYGGSLPRSEYRE